MHLPYRAKIHFSCSKCPKSFQSKRDLKWHNEKCHFEGKFPKFSCKTCKKCFGSKGNLKQHEKTHLPYEKRGHKCYFCKITMSQKQHLFYHLFTHTNEKPYKCAHCNKNFNQSSNLSAHVKTVHALNRQRVKKVRDSKCTNGPEKSYCTIRILKQQQQGHFKDKSFKSETCGNCYKTEYLLMLHCKSHIGEISYKHAKQNTLCEDVQTNLCNEPSSKRSKCSETDLCNKPSSKRSLRSITDLSNEPISERNLRSKSDLCNERSSKRSKSSKTVLFQDQLHNQTRHPSHTCYFCMETFPKVGTLNTHLSTHTKEKPREFKPFEKEFSGNSLSYSDVQLMPAAETDNSTPRYYCDFCVTEYFESKQKLEDHILSHFQENLFPSESL